MPPARPASGAAALREIAAEPLDVDFSFPAGGRRPLREAAADPVEQRLAEVVPIERAQSWQPPARRGARGYGSAQPAVLARWAVVIAVVCMLAALTSGQA